MIEPEGSKNLRTNTHKKCIITLVVLLIFGALPVVKAKELIGQRLKLEGQWTGTILEVEEVEKRDPNKDPQTGYVKGKIVEISHDTQELQIGPFRIEWNETTLFEGFSATQLIPDQFIEVKGRIAGNGRFIAEKLELEEGDGARQYIKILGAVAVSEEQPDGSTLLTVLGIPAVVSKNLLQPENSLTQRLDDKRPDEQLTITLFERPLTIGGEVETDARYRKDFEFDEDEDDITRLGLSVQLEVFYRLSENVAIFVEGEASYEDEIHTEDDDGELEKKIERGEMWLYLGNLFNTGLALQLGRQAFQDEREWWWDQDLDSIRLTYTDELVQLEVGFGQELAKTASNEGQIDPEDEDIFRTLFHGSIIPSRSLRLEAFLLYHHDHSETENENDMLKESNEDEIDSDLVWMGLRASGKGRLGSLGKIHYWLDGAFVTGEETVLDFGSVRDLNGDRTNLSSVDERDKNDVEGWAADVGASWVTPLSWEPTITFSYAIGSGDKDSSRTDNAFRQTGLHDNNNKFRGVDRFRYYGELFSPELSNLQIWTAAFGFPLLKDSSIEIVYHHYHQVEASEDLRDVGIDADLQDDNRNRNIGDELDIVLGIEEWEHWEIELIGGIFWAGPAYGPLSGKSATAAILKINYNF